MDVGVTLTFQNFHDWERYNAKSSAAPIVPDSQIYEEDLHLGSLVEPLGFDRCGPSTTTSRPTS